MTRPLTALLLLFTCLAPALGCTQTIRPPVRPVDPVRVYVADYGLHSSLLLPDGKKPGAYVEFAFGDWGFMALNRTRVQDALGAVLLSAQSSLGRRVVEIENGRMAPTVRDRPRELVGFDAGRREVDRLHRQLEARFQRGLKAGTTDNATDDTVYVKDREHYWVLNNCNHLTRRWLRRLGCDVRGLIATSKFRVDARARETKGDKGKG